MENTPFILQQGPFAPYIYKALITQNSVIGSQTSGVFLVGQIWTITTYVAGDDFSNMTYLSGGTGINSDGAMFVAKSTTPTAWANGSDLTYSGAPYVISTDINGNIAPFVNTLGGVPVFSFGGHEPVITLTGVFIKGKSTIKIQNGTVVADTYTDNNTLRLDWRLMNVPCLIEIEVYA